MQFVPGISSAQTMPASPGPTAVGRETYSHRCRDSVRPSSFLFHFYYDGFIWKVREKSTRQSLGIAGGTADVSLRGFLPEWALHAMKWVAVFVIPLGMLWFAEIHSRRGKLERLASIVADLPSSVGAHFNYATELQNARRVDALNPRLAQPHNYLGKVFMPEGNPSQAIAQFEEALRLHSDFPEAEQNLRVAKETSAQSP
jgi:hypothetical protein